MRKGKQPRLTLVSDETWDSAHRQEGDYPPSGNGSGKWLCFIGSEDAEMMWSKVSEATRQGRLGSHSTMGGQREGYSGRLIEVHTYDWRDSEDVLRIRAELRSIGWVSPIPYKADEDSRSGVYREAGFKKISRYYE